jgi:hypothetical protein
MSHRRNRYMRLEATNCGGGKGTLTTLRSIGGVKSQGKNIAENARIARSAWQLFRPAAACSRKLESEFDLESSLPRNSESESRITSSKMHTYESLLNADFNWALREGSMHFESNSAVHKTLQRIAKRLQELDIDYANEQCQDSLAGNVAIRRPLRTFHRRTVGSWLPAAEASLVSSGENANATAASVCPRNVNSGCRMTRSHRMIGWSWSSLPLARSLPLPENAAV